MPDVQEVFRMATQKVRPEPGFVDRQHDEQRRASRNRRVGAIGLTAALALIGAILIVRSIGSDPKPKPATQPSPTPRVAVDTVPPIGAQTIGLDGRVMGQLPGLPNDAEGLRMSPDGTTIAFMTAGHVATIGIDGTGQQVLTSGTNTNDGDAQNAVSWSPDGTQIAYASSGDLYVVDADGSNTRRLTTDPNGDYYPAWSPDGSTIAYWNGSTTGQDGGPADAELYTIPVTGGTPTRLTDNEIPDIEPAWSPDGKQIAYFSTDAGELRVIRLASMRDRGIYTDGNSGWAPSWSPDGTRIAFLSCCPGSVGLQPLLVVKVVTLATRDASELTADGNAVTVLTDLNGPSWTPDGALLVNRFD
jgi:Tol biopolymer transport system component